MGENSVVGEQRVCADLSGGVALVLQKRRVERGNDNARPDMNAPLLLVADDTHGILAKLDDAFLLQLLHSLD